MDYSAFESQRLRLYESYGEAMTSRTVDDREGRSIYLMERGDGQPVVFLHGGGAEGSNWATFVPRMPDSWRCIVPDRPGCGLTYMLDYRGVAHRHSAAEYLSDLLDGLDLDSASIVANSMGGYFALAFALAHPERVSNLVLMGAPGGVGSQVPLFLRLMGTPVLNRILEKLIGEPDADMIRDKMFGGLLVAYPERVPAKMIDVVVESTKIPGTALAWRTLLQEGTTLFGVRKRHDLTELVAELAVRTLFVWGDKDKVAPPRRGEELAVRMPNAQLVEIADAGHLPWLDQLDPCVEHVVEFIGD